MIIEKTYGLDDHNGVFEIPIYRLNNEDFETELDNYITKQIPFTKEELTRMSGKKNAYENMFQELKSINDYNWKFNEIVGWLTLHLNHEVVFGEIFLKDAKRINKNSSKKIKFHDCGFKIRFDQNRSNKELFDQISEKIDELSKSKLLKKRHIDKLKFETIGPFIDWKKLYSYLNN